MKKSPGRFFLCDSFFSFTGKIPPGRIALRALRRREIMSLERPAAGGESCFWIIPALPGATKKLWSGVFGGIAAG